MSFKFGRIHVQLSEGKANNDQSTKLRVPRRNMLVLTPKTKLNSPEGPTATGPSSHGIYILPSRRRCGRPQQQRTATCGHLNKVVACASKRPQRIAYGRVLVSLSFICAVNLQGLTFNCYSIVARNISGNLQTNLDESILNRLLVTCI